MVYNAYRNDLCQLLTNHLKNMVLKLQIVRITSEFNLNT